MTPERARRPGAVAVVAGLAALAGCSSAGSLPGYRGGSGAQDRAAAEGVTAPAGGAAAPALNTPRSRSLYLTVIRDLRMSGRPYAALANLDEYDRRYGRDDQAGVLRGDCLVDIKAYGQADAVYTRLLHGASAAKAYRGLGRSAGAQGRWKDAAAAFGEAVRREPAAADPLSDLGYALLKSGNASGAVFRLREAHELAPGDPTILNNLILALSATGATDEAKSLMDGLAPAEKARMTALLASPPAAPAAPAATR